MVGRDITLVMPPPTEKDMPRYQRGLVDMCFEEGQYESAITTLDRLRAAKIRPNPGHLQQLLYIALHPPAFAIDPRHPSKRRKLGNSRSTPDSPSKYKQFPVPTTDDSANAVALLNSFLRTNSPAACAAALPCYATTRARPEAEKRKAFDEDEDGGEFVRHARCVGRAKSVWELLAPGVVKRMDAKDEDEEAPTSMEDDDEARVVLAVHTLPVLEWLVTLFEFDAAANPDNFSSLLMAQIPPSPAPNMPQMELHAPLSIVFSLLSTPLLSGARDSYKRRFEPSSEALASQRISLGVRLLSLLIPCTFPMPPPLSPSNLVRRCSYSITSLPMTSLQYLLSSLSSPSSSRIPPHIVPPDISDNGDEGVPSRTILFARFKVALLALCLAQTSENGVIDGLTGSSPVKPIARPLTNGAAAARRRPRPIRVNGTSGETVEPLPPAVNGNCEAPKPAVQQEPYVLSPPDQLLELLSLSPIQAPKDGPSEPSNSRPSTPPPRDSPASVSEEARQKHSILKMAILTALDELNVGSVSTVPASNDTEWATAIRTGRVRDAVEKVDWAGTAAAGMKELAMHLVGKWENRCETVS